MSWPNILTVSRIILAAVLVGLLLKGSLLGNCLAVIVFAVAALTDFYDGHLAKNRGLVSNFGKIMDPIADKVLLLSVFGVLVHIGLVAWWMFIVIALREIAVTVWRLWAMRLGKVLAAERAGKVKTVVQITAVSVILLYLVAQQWGPGAVWFDQIQRPWLGLNYGLMVVTVLMTVYSGIDYLRAAQR